MDLPEIDYDVTVEEYEDVGDLFEDPEKALVEQIIAEGLSLSNLKKRLELESIKRALVETGGNITRAAEILQMKRPRLSQIVNSTDELLSLKEELVG
jgi:ActR/RegA family two-component response regulator